MKTAAAISILATALGLYGAAAQTTPNHSAQTSRSRRNPGKTGALAMHQAADAKQYLFAFIYEQNDDATSAARKTFDAGVAKITPAPKSVAVDRSDPTEKEMVEQFKLEAAPMPLVLAIAPQRRRHRRHQRSGPHRSPARGCCGRPRHAAMPEGASGPKAHLRLPAERQHQSQ